jgi:hypothetical protein
LLAAHILLPKKSILLKPLAGLPVSNFSRKTFESSRKKKETVSDQTHDNTAKHQAKNSTKQWYKVDLFHLFRLCAGKFGSALLPQSSRI